MKFVKLLLLPILFAPILSGCPASDQKVDLHYGSYAQNELTTITQPELASKVDSKESFIAVVSPGHAGCMCWQDFKVILNDYIKDNHVIIYEISYNSFFDASNNQLNTFGLDIRKEMETFALFSKGELKTQSVYSSSNSMFKQPSAFKEYLEGLISKPTMYFISLDQLTSIYQSGKEAVIYFARSNCPDCQAVEIDFLREYTVNHREANKLYILDCETIGIREYDEEGHLTPESAARWQEFKNDYGLASVNNEQFGHTTGVVPTFQLIKGNGASYSSSILSSSVYFNDSLENEGGQVKIKESFYSEARKGNLQYINNVETKILEGMIIPENDYYTMTFGLNTYYIWKNECAERYHSPLLSAFLDYALPQVTHSF